MFGAEALLWEGHELATVKGLSLFTAISSLERLQMVTWFNTVRDLLSDNIYDGLSFILSLAILIVPIVLKRFNQNSTLRIVTSKLFWLLSPPILAICLLLSAYFQRIGWAVIFCLMLIVIHLWLQWQAEQLNQAFEKSLLRVSDLEISMAKLQESFNNLAKSIGQKREQPIIKPS